MQTGFDFADGTPSFGAFQVRDFKGYHQAREGAAGPWRFYVCGFGATDSRTGCGSCRVLRSDGSREQVPIDGNNFITILGRRYGPTHWSH